MIHDAVESEVAIARDVGAQRRDRSIRRTSVLPTSAKLGDVAAVIAATA
jgi:hypothetical protein